jgi:hypothetical protein
MPVSRAELPVDRNEACSLSLLFVHLRLRVVVLRRTGLTLQELCEESAGAPRFALFPAPRSVKIFPAGVKKLYSGRALTVRMRSPQATGPRLQGRLLVHCAAGSVARGRESRRQVSVLHRNQSVCRSVRVFGRALRSDFEDRTGGMLTGHHGLIPLVFPTSRGEVVHDRKTEGTCRRR